MKHLNANNGSYIETLKYRIEKEVKIKDRRVKELKQKISEIEDVVIKFRQEADWFDEYQKQLRQKREIIETACFRKICKIHKQILQITKHLKNT